MKNGENEVEIGEWLQQIICVRCLACNHIVGIISLPGPDRDKFLDSVRSALRSSKNPINSLELFETEVQRRLKCSICGEHQGSVLIERINHHKRAGAMPEDVDMDLEATEVARAELERAHFLGEEAGKFATEGGEGYFSGSRAYDPSSGKHNVGFWNPL